MNPASPIGRRGRIATVVPLLGVIAIMVGLVSYSVTLYQWFCQVTGYGGTTQIAETAPEIVADREIAILFNADINPNLPWTFEPAQRQIRVRLGEQALAFYEAENVGDKAVTGTATFNVTPAKAGIYFNKIECFCFTEQRLEPGQRVDMPVTFYVDPALADDPNLAEVETIVLSYTFFASRREAPAETADRAAASDDAPSRLN